MTTTIYDSSGRPYGLQFDSVEGTNIVRIHVFDGTRKIGYANLAFGITTMTLDDLCISYNVVYQRRGLEDLICRVFQVKPKVVNYRKRGLGTRLLLTVMEYAKSRGMTEVKGRLVTKDLDCNPHLRDWYRKHGFSISESDEILLRVR